MGSCYPRTHPSKRRLGCRRRAKIGRVEVTFRRAVRDDVPDIVRLLADDVLGRGRELWADPLPDAYWRAFDAIDADASELLIVGEIDGAVVSTLQLSFLPSLSHRGATRAQIEAVRVAAELRGTGVGHRLVGWALERAREHGCSQAQLSSSKTRTDAHRLYESLGFEASHEGMKRLL